MYAKILQRLLNNFFVTMGRAPLTPKEWSKLRARAMELSRKEEGIPSVTKNTTIQDLMTGPHMSDGPKGQRMWDFSKDLPTRDVQSRTADIIPFPKGQKTSKGLMGLMRKGDVTVGKAPKTLPEHLKAKKDRHILMRDADEDISRMKRENKSAIERFKEKFLKNDPDKFYAGGLAPLVGEPSYAADFYDDRTPYKTGLKVYPKIDIQKSGSTPEGVDVDKRDTTYGGTGLIEGDKWYGGAELLKRKSKVDVTADGQTVYKDTTSPEDTVNWVLGYGEPEGDKFQIKADEDADNFGIVFKKKLKKKPKYIFKKAQGGRIGLAGGGALFKFIERLFIKASNDIRQGKGKWKGLDLKQRIVQHDNLTKKVVEFEKTGNTEGLEIYFDVNPHEAFAAASKKAKAQTDELVQSQTDELIQAEKGKMASDEDYIPDIIDPEEVTQNIGKVHRLDERTMLKQKYPGITDDLVEKILVDDNPQRKADVMGTIDDYMKLKEIGKSEAEAYDIITKSFSKNPTKHAEGGRISNQSGGPLNQEALIQMYLEEGLSYDEAVAAAQSTSGLDMDISKKAEGGRAEFIFGGSAGLKAMWKQVMKGISKGRDKPITKLFPKLSAEDRAIEKMVMGHPEQKAFRAREKDLKVEGIDMLINRLKHDKKILERQAKNKAMGDPGLDFLMKKLEENMSEAYTPHLKKYTNIDKDILDMETIKKNMIMKDRKLNAEGGRVSYSGGGRAGLPAITYGTPQMNMQGPQMPSPTPQPAGVPGVNLQQNQMDLMQQKMQQNPWMQNQGMQKPQYGGQLRMPFGLGGMSRRAFMKMMAGAAALPFIGKGISKVAPKAIPKVTETAEVITRGADGMPKYIYDLIEVVKAKGTRDVIEGFKKSDYSTVHRYKGVEVIEEAGGATRIKKGQEKAMYGSDEPSYHEVEMEISPRYREQSDPESGLSWYKDEKGRKVYETEIPDEYAEYTAKPDMDGKLKDVDEYIDDMDHLELKTIADERKTLFEDAVFKPDTLPGIFEKTKKTKKASGGLAYALGE